MSLEQIEQMVRAANPVPDVSILGESNGNHAGEVDEPKAHTTADDLARERRTRRRSMLGAAAMIAVLALGLLAVTAVQDPDNVPTDTVPPTPTPTTTPDTIDTAAPVAPPAPFVGVWESTDTDGSSQTMEINRSGTDEYEVVVRDGLATTCSGAPATMTGGGLLEHDLKLVIAQPVLTCGGIDRRLRSDRLPKPSSPTSPSTATRPLTS